MSIRNNSGKLAASLLAFLCIGFVLLMGGVSLPGSVTELKTYLGPEADPGPEEYRLSFEELTVPEVPAYFPPEMGGTPKLRTPFDPGFSLKSSYKTAEFFQGTVGYVKLNVRNEGSNPIFIDRCGVALNTSERPVYTKDTGALLLPDEEKNLGIVAVRLPEADPQPSLQIALWLLAKSQDGKWHEYKEAPQYLEEFTVDAKPLPEKINPACVYNPSLYFRPFNELVDSSDPEIRSTAAGTARAFGGTYNIYQVCALFDRVSEDIEYVTDPRGNDIWEPANVTLKTGAGDCEDQAVLLAALIEAVGGTTRLYLTDSHAFAAVYIGNETGQVAKAVEGVRAYYGNVDVYYLTDEYGSWLMLDTTSSLYAGGLPGKTAPVRIEGAEGDAESWTFLNTSEVKVIDITANPNF